MASLKLIDFCSSFRFVSRVVPVRHVKTLSAVSPSRRFSVQATFACFEFSALELVKYVAYTLQSRGFRDIVKTDAT